MRLPIVSALVSPVRFLQVWSWLLPLLVTGPVQAGDIVIGMSAAFKGPRAWDRSFGIACSAPVLRLPLTEPINFAMD